MIVGREHELVALNAAYEQMLAGRGSVLFLTGEAGLGKTTLVHSWWSSLRSLSVVRSPLSGDAAGKHGSPHGQPTTDNGQRLADNGQPAESSLFLESACSIPIGNVDVGRLEALQPWIDIGEGLVRRLQEEGEEKEKKGQRKFDLGKFLIDTAPSWITMIPILGPSVGAAVEIFGAGYDQVYLRRKIAGEQGGQSGQTQQQVFQQYANLLLSVADDTPLVLFLDDLHWADTSSCNLLFYLARQLAGKRVLIIGTYRPDEALAGDEPHPIIKIKNEILRYEIGGELQLSYLRGSAIRDLLRATFPEYVIDDKFERWLARISDGNALFVSQFIRTLREDGHLNDRGVFVGSYGDIAIPLTALAVVEERTRRLDSDTRQLLTYATAEGEEFTSYVLSSLTHIQPLQLLKELKRAQRLDMIREKGVARVFANQTTTVFGFSHALFHQALYGELSTEERAILHRQCFSILKDWWDQQGDGGVRTISFATKLLTHAESCGELQTAAAVAQWAAAESWRTFNEEEAIGLLDRACAAAAGGGDIRGKAEAAMLRGRIGAFRGRMDEGLRLYREAESLYAQAGERTRAIDAVNGAALTLHRWGAHDDAVREGMRALDAAVALGYAEGEWRAANILGLVAHTRTRLPDAITWFQRSAERAGAVGDRQGEAFAYSNMGTAHMDGGSYDAAAECFHSSLRIQEEGGREFDAAGVMVNLGSIAYYRHRYREALEWYERSLGIFRSVGHRLGEANALANAGNAHLNLREFDEAIACNERSTELFRFLGNVAGEAASLNNMAMLRLETGDVSRALELAEKALALAESADLPFAWAYAQMAIGLCRHRLGDAPQAREAMEQARGVAERVGLRPLAADCTEHLAQFVADEAERADAAVRGGLRDDARALFAQAESQYDTLHLTEERDRCRAERERIERAGDR